MPRGKSRYFPHKKSTNLFPFDIDRVIHQTYTHNECMYISVFMYVEVHAYMCIRLALANDSVNVKRKQIS